MSNGGRRRGEGTEPTESSGTAAQRGARPGTATPRPRAGRVGRGRTPGGWAGGGAACLPRPWGAESAGLSCPRGQRSGLWCAPGGRVPPRVPRGCQGAVGELLPCSGCPWPGGSLVGGKEAGAGRYRSAGTLLGGSGAGPWVGLEGHQLTLHPCPEQPQRCLPIFGILLVSPPCSRSQGRDSGPSGQMGKLRVRGCPQDPQRPRQDWHPDLFYSRAPLTMLLRAQELRRLPPPTLPPDIADGRVTPR